MQHNVPDTGSDGARRPASAWAPERPEGAASGSGFPPSSRDGLQPGTEVPQDRGLFDHPVAGNPVLVLHGRLKDPAGVIQVAGSAGPAGKREPYQFAGAVTTGFPSSSSLPR